MKVAIVVDSTSYLPANVLEKYNIFTIPLNVIVDGDIYKENEIENSWYYQQMNDLEELPTTSQPSIGDYIVLLETLHGQGYTDVISFHLSQEISGTYASAIAAGQSVDGINLHVVDSEVACAPMGFMALYAAQQLGEKSLEEVIDDVEMMKNKDHTNAFFLVDDLTNLQKGGRLSNAQAIIGGLLKIKPVLEFMDGKIVAIEKIRTQKKAIAKVKEKIDQEFKKHKGKQITACVVHGNDLDYGQKILREMQDEFPDVNFILQEFGPVIGTHLGQSSLAIGFTTFDIDVSDF